MLSSLLLWLWLCWSSSPASGLLFRDDIASAGPDCVIVLEKFARPRNLNCEMEEARQKDREYCAVVPTRTYRYSSEQY